MVYFRMDTHPNDCRQPHYYTMPEKMELISIKF